MPSWLLDSKVFQSHGVVFEVYTSNLGRRGQPLKRPRTKICVIQTDLFGRCPTWFIRYYGSERAAKRGHGQAIAHIKETGFLPRSFRPDGQGMRLDSSAQKKR